MWRLRCAREKFCTLATTSFGIGNTRTDSDEARTSGVILQAFRDVTSQRVAHFVFARAIKRTEYRHSQIAFEISDQIYLTIRCGRGDQMNVSTIVRMEHILQQSSAGCCTDTSNRGHALGPSRQSFSATGIDRYTHSTCAEYSTANRANNIRVPVRTWHTFLLDSRRLLYRAAFTDESIIFTTSSRKLAVSSVC